MTSMHSSKAVCSVKRHLLQGLLALALLLGSTPVQAYRFQTMDPTFAGSHSVFITGLNAAGVLVGAYQDKGGRNLGFLRDGTRLFPLLNVAPQGINASGSIVGSFVAPPRDLQGFLLTDGTFTPFNVPEPDTLVGGARLTQPTDLNDAGIVVGAYQSARDSRSHGFRYDAVTQRFTTFDVPGAHDTALTGVSNNGRLVGYFFDANIHYHAIRDSGPDLVEVTIAELPEIYFVGVTDDGTIAGNGFGVGFVRSRLGEVDLVEVPNATATTIEGIRNDGVVYGAYLDQGGALHGFLAVPDGQQRRRQRQSPVNATAVQALIDATCGRGGKHPQCRDLR